MSLSASYANLIIFFCDQMRIITNTRKKTQKNPNPKKPCNVDVAAAAYFIHVLRNRRENFV